MKIILFAALLAAALYVLYRTLSRKPVTQRPSPAAADQMDRQEALKVLGLAENPSREEVIAAHRRLMQKVHPDHGGSTYLAQQLNEAKRVLLARR